MKGKKNGISLIVLVITIIVMAILATAIIVSLDNSGIINKSKEAVEKTNLKQVQEIASIAWAEAYIAGKTTQVDLEKAVLDALSKAEIDKNKYNITVSTSGVEVQLKNNKLNEYGFYYEKLYKEQILIDEEYVNMGMVFHANGKAVAYVQGSFIGASGEDANKLFATDVYEASYSKGQITMKYEDGSEEIVTVSNDGKTIGSSGSDLTCTFEDAKTINKGVLYTGTYEELDISFVMNSDNSVKIKTGDNEYTTNDVDYMINNVALSVNVTINNETGTIVILSSIDGENVIMVVNNIVAVLKATEVVDNTEQIPTVDNGGLYDESGNLVASWSTLVDTYGLDIEKDYSEDSYSEDTTRFGYVLANNEELSAGTHLIVSNTVTHIGAYALTNSTLSNVTLSTSLKSIGQGAFGACFNLTSIDIPNGVESIGPGAFTLCMNLATITLPNTLNTISESAFTLTGLTSLNIPAGVSNIGNGICDGVYNLTSITVDAANQNYKAINGDIYTIDGKKLVQYASGKQAVLTIPDGVETIGCRSISGSYVTGVIIPDSVITIEDSAMFDCPKLTTITFGTNSKLTTIGDYAFKLCKALNNISIPSSVTIISEEMFRGCGLTSINIPAQITTIGNSAFEECDTLETITFAENSNLTIIEEDAFWGCRRLTSLILPAKLTSIGNSAFYNNEKLTNLTLLSTTPPTITANLVLDDLVALTSITVPAGTADAYKAATGWSNYSSIIVEATE